MKLYFTILLLTITTSLVAQTLNYRVVTNINGSYTTWSLTPVNYNPANKYPHMIYIGGSGEIGTGTRSTDSTRMMKYGPIRAVRTGTWNQRMRFLQLDGSYVDTPVIVSCLQPRAVTTSQVVLQRVSDSLLSFYPTDTMRMIVTGLSMGGQMINQALMSYVSSGGANYDKFSHWSAALVFSTPGPTSGAAVRNLQTWLSKGGFYYYGIGSADFASTMIRESTLDSLKGLYPTQLYARTYPSEDHCCWNSRYTGAYRDPEFTDNSIYNMAGIRDKYPKAMAEDLITTNGSAVIIHGKIAGHVAVAQWSLVSGPNTPTITPGADTTATISGLIDGTYTIRLRSRNGNGSSASYFDWQTVIQKSSGFTVIKKNYKIKKRGRKLVYRKAIP